MHKRTIKSDALLVLTAFLWGTTFVAQRRGMDHVGPMTFNAMRFFLGALTLLPLIYWRRNARDLPRSPSRRLLIWGSIVAGALLFGGASLQQVSLLYTTAGKCAFITGLYVVLVPIMGLFLGHRSGVSLWIGMGLTTAGLYFLSVTESFTIAKGDLLALGGAVFWAVYMLWIGYMAKRASTLRIACIQFATCAAMSLGVALFTEQVALTTIRQAVIPIAYAGFFSAGIAFTLQVFCQRTSPPSHAVIILSLEAVFAALAGVVMLDEQLNTRELVGCVLMFFGPLIVQIPPLIKRPSRLSGKGQNIACPDKSVAVPN